MRHRATWLLITLACCVLLAPLAGDAQPLAKVPRIGILTPASEASTPAFEAFQRGPRELGYVEGQNIVLEFRLAAGWMDRLPDLATQLTRRKVDVILTDSPAAAQAAKHATTTIPIVMATVGDPVHAGLIASLARPGGNVTGLTLLAPGLNGKRLELLKEAVPGVAQVAVMWNPTNPAAMQYLRETEAAATSLRLRLQALEVPGPDTIEAAFAAATKGQADALITVPDAMLWNQRTTMADLAAQHRLPALFPEREFVDAGGLLSYGPSVPANFHRAATYVDKI